MSLDVQIPQKEGSCVTPPHINPKLAVKSILGDEVTKSQLLPSIDVKAWVQVVNTWKVKATHEEENAA